MNSQQLHDHITKPTLEYMGSNYYSKDAAFLLLCTAAIESNCGYYIKQVGGLALGPWQMEPETESDIWQFCDALHEGEFASHIDRLIPTACEDSNLNNMMASPAYACAMARLKYSMDKAPLPDRHDIKAVYLYYKRIFNTPLGASNYTGFKSALANNYIMDVKL